jgi:hypothetical protein
VTLLQQIGVAIQAAEKLKFLSFRGTLRAEESLILLDLKPGEIPRFARNDKIIYFFRSLYSQRKDHPASLQGNPDHRPELQPLAKRIRWTEAGPGETFERA